MIFTDRYTACGIDYPHPDTVCLGHCEGIGFYPENDSSEASWQQGHKEHNLFMAIKNAWKYKDITYLWTQFQCDGWHFVRCAECNGTGKREQ